jgi:two-component system chemotaxis response regulator CheY
MLQNIVPSADGDACGLVESPSAVEIAQRAVSVAKRALLCDDARVTRRMITDYLHEDGWSIVGEAETAADVVQLFHQRHPDLVTMDLALKGGADGIWAIREIRKSHPLVPIVVVSSVMQPNVVAEALEAGASDYVSKPFTPEHLREAVSRCVAVGASTSI